VVPAVGGGSVDVPPRTHVLVTCAGRIVTVTTRASASYDHRGWVDASGDGCLETPKPSLGVLQTLPNGRATGVASDLVGSILSTIRVPADIIEFDAGDGSSSVSERDFRAGIPR
jgi:hypothetical protein